MELIFDGHHRLRNPAVQPGQNNGRRVLRTQNSVVPCGFLGRESMRASFCLPSPSRNVHVPELQSQRRRVLDAIPLRSLNRELARC